MMKTSKPSRAARATWEFCLYVVNHTPKSIKASDNLKRLCKLHLPGKCRIEVIDLKKHPEQARSARILAVPTLIRKKPLPVRTCIGDLSDLEAVLAAFELCGAT